MDYNRSFASVIGPGLSDAFLTVRFCLPAPLATSKLSKQPRIRYPFSQENHNDSYRQFA